MSTPARLAALVLVALLCAGGALAQTTVTTTGSDGNWSASGTWTGGVVPNNNGGNTYAVQILNTPTAPTVTLDTNITVNSLLLQSDTQLATTSGSTLALGSLDTAGDVEFVNANTLTVSGGTTVETGGTLSLGAATTGQFSGGFANNGTVAIGFGGQSGNTININSDLNNAGTFTMFGTQNDSLAVSGTLNNSGTFGVFGTNNVVNVAALNNTGVLSITATNTLNITGGGLGVTDIAAGSSISLGGSFNVINGQNTTSALANLTTVEGGLTLTGGPSAPLTITPNGTDTVTFAQTAVVNISNDSTLNVNGNLINNGSVCLGCLGGGADVLNVTGTLTNNGSILMMDGVSDPIMAGELNNMGHLTIGPGDAFYITGGGGVTSIAANTSLTIEGDLFLQPGGMGPVTSGIANLTTVDGALTLENKETTTITPTTGTLAIGSTGSFTIGNTGTTVNLNGDLSVVGDSGSQGALVVSDGGNSLNITGNVINSGGSVLVGMGSSLAANGSYTQTGNGTTNIIGSLSAASFSQSGGTTIVQEGSTLTAPTVQIIGGSLQGGGFITGDVSLTNGNLMPGTPGLPDVLGITGNYTQGKNGTLIINIGDLGIGEFSALNISGLATLDGAVDFNALGDFNPEIGDVITFLTFGTLSGDFSNILFTGWSCPVGAVCQEVVGNGTISLDIVAASVNTPEPATVALLGSGLAAGFALRRRRRA